MDLGLSGKAALVTGASKGIGAAVAIALAREGADVLAVARSSANLEAPGPANSAVRAGRIFSFQADLTEAAAFDAVHGEMLRLFGRIDILSNNAGSTKPGDFLALSDEAWEQGFALKFHSARRLARTCGPTLRAAKGCIVNTIGIMSRTAVIDYAMGGAVNTSLYHLTKALADLGVREGVRVNAVNPGRIATDRREQSLAKIIDARGISRADAEKELLDSCGIARFGTTEEVASAVCFLASERAGFINGAILDVDGGQTRGL
ncbi:SDR family oxidoreductase [Paraburkholderia youngii]|uniref:SDR family oxidoreductase n=1 Tax=Paraburkholderia youngii TaxID=2782701 RepID=A0A7Y6N1Y6_9BURK|nr:SDR family oxidoreductase [Paraburkholderia youngii]NUY05688.1 SDR family oxidoreductase [Paraburkholderia youngii]